MGHALVLQRARAIGHHFFHAFGIHCATHQIRIILVSCVVITSLFYPALAIYWSSKPQYLSSSRAVAFLTGNTFSGAQHDLHNVWTGHNSLRVRDDSYSRPRCGAERTIRIERILIQSPLTGDDGALNHQILVSTMDLQHSINELLRSEQTPCLRGQDGQCFVLSPLAFWHHDKDLLLSDPNILETLTSTRNVLVSGIPVTPRMVLAGLGSANINEPSDADFDYVDFLAMTYFFPDTDCFGGPGHAAWSDLVQAAINPGAQIDPETQEPTLMALELETNTKEFSIISIFLYLAYFTFTAYVVHSMRRMDRVHSRIGLTFTALVEICVSTITSLSVCALAGFKVTMVPWELLPIVIVFVGAENMFNLVDAVSKTSVTLPVKERIATGLSKAGTSNTLKVVSYNAILGVIAVFSAGAIRQFCAFAIVVLVAHWFLGHTFFMAVLSIDIQRLELDELLQQNANLAPTGTSTPHETTPTPASVSKWSSLARNGKKLLRGRANKNISLFLLLAITGTLYYTSSPSAKLTNPASQRGALRANRTNATFGEHLTPSHHIWKLLNPNNDELVHIRTETTVLILQSESGRQQLVESKVHRLRVVRMLRSLLWIAKIVVFPIAATTTVLYGLLLYLLKNAELLEAQRNRTASNLNSVNNFANEEASSMEGHASFTCLPRAFATDTDLIVASKDGKTVASVGLDNELAIWQTETQAYSRINATELLLGVASASSTPSAITALALDDSGKYCAVGTSAGSIAVWHITGDTHQKLPYFPLANSSSAVVDLLFVHQRVTIPQGGPRFEPPSPTGLISGSSLVAVYGNGSVLKWRITVPDEALIIAPPRPELVTKTVARRAYGDERILVCHFMTNGGLQVSDPFDNSMDPLIMRGFSVQAGNPSDLVSKVDICRVEVCGMSTLLVGVATKAGVVSIWDGGTGECLHLFDDTFGEVNRVRLIPIPCETCHLCGELPLESFGIAVSVGTIVVAYKAYIPQQSRRCACVRNQPRTKASTRDVKGRRSRSGSFMATGNSTTLSNKGPRPTSTFDTPAFPISGHGIRSRRVSEKDAFRRNGDFFAPPLPEDVDLPKPNESPRTALAPSGASQDTSSKWQNLMIVGVIDITCDRGGWDISGSRMVGICRRSRISRARLSSGGRSSFTSLFPPTASALGLTPATLDRWEIWSYDLLTLHQRNSPLAALTSPQSSETTPTDKDHPRLPFTRVTPVCTHNSSVYAGLGNTIGKFKLS